MYYCCVYYYYVCIFITYYFCVWLYYHCVRLLLCVFVLLLFVYVLMLCVCSVAVCMCLCMMYMWCVHTKAHVCRSKDKFMALVSPSRFASVPEIKFSLSGWQQSLCLLNISLASLSGLSQQAFFLFQLSMDLHKVSLHKCTILSCSPWVRALVDFW